MPELSTLGALIAQYAKPFQDAAEQTITNKRMPVLTTQGDGARACAIPVLKKPATGSYVEVRVNGQAQNVGPGLDCFFSGDNGASARQPGGVQQGDLCFWNGTNAGFELQAGSDLMDFMYEEGL